MSDFYNGPTSGIHSMFDQELAEFMRPKYEAYLNRTLAPPATPEEQMKAELVERVAKEVEKAREGIVMKMPTDTPQRPPTRRKQPA